MEAKERLARAFAFGAVARDYEAVRPGYPASLMQAVIRRAALDRQSTILEIGCGTGQATETFAVHGCAILCLEPTREFAQLATRNLARFPRVQVRTEMFEHAELAAESFDLVLAATAFHWIDPAIRYEKAACVLRHAGTLALLMNVYPTPLVGFFARVQDVYRAVAPTLAHTGGASDTEQGAAELREELVHNPYFEEVECLSERWQKRYTCQEYLTLLNTFSGHRLLEEERRTRLLAAIGNMIDAEYGGYVEQPFVTMLYMARKRHSTWANTVVSHTVGCRDAGVHAPSRRGHEEARA